jgi:hypothetical protein
MAPHLYYQGVFMLKRFSTAFLCGLAVAGQMCAQEVVVARETKPDAPKQATRPSEWTEPELGTSTRTKPHVREAKSASAVPTLEQMRMAGALAAERLEGRPLQEASAAGESSSRTARAGTSNAFGAVEPMGKETRVQQTSAPRAPNSRTTKSEGIAPVRPTMIESGKQEPEASPPAKAEARGGQATTPQSANRPLRKQETILSQLANKATARI